MKLLVGMVTYGQLKYTKLAVKYLYKHTSLDFDFLAIVGKPGDEETKQFFKDKQLTFISHNENKGFPYSLNDIYEYAFVDNDYDNVVIIGNDVLVYPEAITDLVQYQQIYGWDYVSGQEISSRHIRKKIPELQKYFDYAGKLIGDDFPHFTKYKFTKTDRKYDLSKFDIIGDTHNMTLFTRNWFDTVGYVDVNFYPAYFEDNDYARRGQLLGMKMFQIQRAKYFHFWSRTIKEDEQKRRENDFYFPLNKKYYIEKWGGEPGKEKYSIPFNERYNVICGKMFPPEIAVHSREHEDFIVDCWRRKRR